MVDAPMNWNDLANTRVDEVEPPKLIPPGHYQGLITGVGKVENKGKNKTLVITYPMKLTEPQSDVDREAFEASDGFKDSYDLQFWLTPASLYRFTEFGIALGAAGDYSVPEMAEFLATCGEAFIVQVKQEADEKNPKRVYLRVDNPISLAEFSEAA
jgi:hypothetical protein